MFHTKLFNLVAFEMLGWGDLIRITLPGQWSTENLIGFVK